MEKIFDDLLKDYYIKKYQINDYFDSDIREQLSLFKFKSGEYIYKDGDYLNYFYFYVDGKAKVFSRLSNGKSLLLSFYGPLQLLGDIELFSIDYVMVNVKTISESHCLGIPIDYVRTHLTNDNKFLRYVCENLGSKLNRCSNNSSINLLYPLENRLASYIVAIDSNEKSDQCILTLHDSLTEIAELLGASYRHLHRTVNLFVDKGILKKDKRDYIIIDKSPLKGMATDLYSNIREKSSST